MRALCPSEAYSPPLLAVAGYALAGADPQFPVTPLPDHEWDEMLEGAVANRLTGELWSAIETKEFPTTPAQVEQARARCYSALFWTMRLEGDLVALARSLTANDIDFRVLKGAAVASLDYPDAGLRTFVDVDILVRAVDFDRTVATLTNAGFTRSLVQPEQPKPGFYSRFDKGATLVSPTGYELDLHRTFVLGPWGLRVDLEDLWEPGQEFVLAGHPLSALSPVNRLLHACYHAALGDWPLRLASLRDVAEMLRSDEVAEAARNRARRWGAEAVVAAAISDACRLLDLPAASPITAWAAGFVPSQREERRLALHTQPDKTFAAQAFSTLWALPRLRDKAAYARALALPDRRYIAGRHRSTLARFRYGLSEMRRGRGHVDAR